MSLSPPILPSTIDPKLREYIFRLNSELSSLSNSFEQLKSHPLMTLSKEDLTLLTSSNSNPSQDFNTQQVYGLGQLSQGQYTYAPIVSILPSPGDPLYQNGQIVFLFSGGMYHEYVFDGSVEPGTWRIVGGSGTVTSVDMTVPARLTIVGNPITGSGTLGLGENSHTYDKTLDSDATPVTVNANSTSDQNLSTFTFGTPDLDTLAKAVHIYAAGVYSTQAGQTPTIRFRLFLGGVQILNWQSNATTASAIDMNWEIDSYIIVTTTGVNGKVEAHGHSIVALGTVGGNLAETYLDTINAVSAVIAVNAGPVLQVTGRFSTQPAGAPRNSITERVLIVSQMN